VRLELLVVSDDELPLSLCTRRAQLLLLLLCQLELHLARAELSVRRLEPSRR